MLMYTDEEIKTPVTQNARLPIEIEEPYDGFYGNGDLNVLFDMQLWLDVITFGNYRKMLRALLKEIRPGDRVLQMGATFGIQTERTAYAVGINGKYTLIDTRRSQIRRCENKYNYLLANLDIRKGDARNFKNPEKYNVVICWNLLHELPPLSKIRAVNNALDLLAPKGKAIFIDYHNPSKWNPLRYFIRMFNRLYQPFAEKIWEREISTYAAKRTDYSWRKSVFSGGMYQKVVATRKR